MRAVPAGSRPPQRCAIAGLVAAMSLSDDIAAAEARAREIVMLKAATWATAAKYPTEFSPPEELAAEIMVSVDRLAAVCRLAGRWEHMAATSVDFYEPQMRAELAALVREMEP